MPIRIYNAYQDIRGPRELQIFSQQHAAPRLECPHIVGYPSVCGKSTPMSAPQGAVSSVPLTRTAPYIPQWLRDSINNLRWI